MQAAGGGGGALYIFQLSNAVVTCPASSAPSPAAAASVLDAQGLLVGCPGLWRNNRALYGPATATSALRMSLLRPNDSAVQAYRSFDEMHVELDLIDALGQRILGKHHAFGQASYFWLIIILDRSDAQCKLGHSIYWKNSVRDWPGSHCYPSKIGSTTHCATGRCVKQACNIIALALKISGTRHEACFCFYCTA